MINNKIQFNTNMYSNMYSNTPILMMVKIKGLWKWFIQNYLNGLDWVRSIQTSKIFRVLTKKQTYLKYHYRWKNLNEKEVADTIINNIYVWNNNNIIGKTFFWENNRNIVCKKCACLAEICGHHPKLYKNRSRIYLSLNARKKCEICFNYFVDFKKCNCKKKEKFRGYKLYKPNSRNSAKYRAIQFPKNMSKNTRYRIAIRNKILGQIIERIPKSSYEEYSLPIHYTGRGWKLFKAKYDNLQNIIKLPCENCELKTKNVQEIINHNCYYQIKK